MKKFKLKVLITESDMYCIHFRTGMNSYSLYIILEQIAVGFHSSLSEVQLCIHVRTGMNSYSLYMILEQTAVGFHSWIKISICCESQDGLIKVSIRRGKLTFEFLMGQRKRQTTNIGNLCFSSMLNILAFFVLERKWI